MLAPDPRSAAVTQRSHLDLENYLPYLINRVGAALVESFTANTLAAHDLSIAMWRVLAALSNNGGQRQVDLATMTSTDASTLSRLVTRLVRIGLVTRSRSKQSSREVLMALSPKGAALVDRLIPIARQLAGQGDRRDFRRGPGGGEAGAPQDAREHAGGEPDRLR